MSIETRGSGRPTTRYAHGTTRAVKVATEQRQAAEQREKADALRADNPDVASMFERQAAEHDRNAELYAEGPEDLGWSPNREEPAITVVINPFKVSKWDGKVRSTKSTLTRPVARARENRSRVIRVAAGVARSTAHGDSSPSSSDDDSEPPAPGDRQERLEDLTSRERRAA